MKFRGETKMKIRNLGVWLVKGYVRHKYNFISTECITHYWESGYIQSFFWSEFSHIQTEYGA